MKISTLTTKERVDRIKSPEDDWVSHILGNEIDVIDTLIDN